MFKPSNRVRLGLTCALVVMVLAVCAGAGSTAPDPCMPGSPHSLLGVAQLGSGPFATSAVAMTRALGLATAATLAARLARGTTSKTSGALPLLGQASAAEARFPLPLRI
jgi:hypothetical protein